MKLKTKFNLLAVLILVVMTIAIVVVGRVIVLDLAQQLHSRILQSELRDIQTAVLGALNHSGVDAAVNLTAQLQASVQDELGLSSAQLYIIEKPHRVIFHPDLVSGETIAHKVFDSILKQENGSGTLFYDDAGGSYFAAYAIAEAPQWMFVFALGEEEMYAKQVEYLGEISGVAFIALGIVLLIVSVYMSRVVRRLQDTLNCVKQIDIGNFDACDIPVTGDDEISHLQAGVKAMSSSLKARSIEAVEAEHALRESEAKYRQIIDTANEGVWVQDDEYITTFVNDHMAQMLGYSCDEIIGRPVTDFMFDEGVVSHNHKMEERKQNHSDIYERRMRHKDGHEVWMLISASPLFADDGQFLGSFAMLTNIDRQKKVERELVASEQLFRTMVENSPDNIVRYDRDLRRVYINSKLKKEFSVPVEQAMGKTSKTASPLIDPDSYMAKLRQVRDTGQECIGEISYHSSQGDIHWASARFAPEFGLDGEVVSVLVISSDITQQKLAELERIEYTRFLESLDRVNRIFQTEDDVEKMLGRTLDEVLDIFDCDRTYLQYPCDPDAIDEWWVPLERWKPGYPSPLPSGQRLRFNPHIQEILSALLASETPIQLGPGTDRPIPAEITDALGVRSLMATALHPRVDRPWQFAIHQCSRDRLWSDQEVRLFDEISHRLSNALNDLLVTRNLRESEERFRLVYENSPVPIWEEDFSEVKLRLDELVEQHGDELEAYLCTHSEIVTEFSTLVRILNVNNAALELHEADSKEALIEGLPKTFTDESYFAFRQGLIALARGETDLVVDGTVQTLSGQSRDVSVALSVCPGFERSLSKVFVSMFDITQRKQDEESLRLAASVFSTSQEGILFSGPDNLIIDTNPAFTRLTGYSREEALGQNPKFLSSGRQSQEFYAEMWRTINERGIWQGELWNRRKTGEEYAELLSITAIRDEAGELLHYVGVFSDISILKQHEAELERSAHYDSLTSVPNRRLLSDLLQKAIARSRRHGKSLAVCYLDLDGFKPINDQFGHQAGDRVLVEIARRLQAVSRSEDIVARLGGDEFVLLWNDIGEEFDWIQAVGRVLDEISRPLYLQDDSVSVSASIGITIYPEDDVDADALLRHADHAMYLAKQLGKNRYQMFDAQLERQIASHAEYIDKIARALGNQQFELFYQPKVDCASNQVVGVEALLRWNDPILGLVQPREFLSLIENDGLAFHMGRWVLDEAVRQARLWDEKGIVLPISINVFPIHLNSRTFADDLREAINRNWPKMPAGRLMMEIVETSALEQIDLIESVIQQCLQEGVGFSLDDFGTGYSSLVYLRRLSIEELKIDQSFVKYMIDNPDDRAIVQSVIQLGEAFDLRVVAEGVESVRHAKMLMELGCNIVQGYALGRPMSSGDIEQWYAEFLIHGASICN